MNNKLLNSAIRALSRRAYHSEEMKAKLLQKDATLEEVKEVIAKLHGYKYLNDAAYIENYIQDQLRRKPQSVRLSKQKLLQKGVPAEQINPVIQKFEPSELERAMTALAKKTKTLRSASPLQRKQKLSRFLASRGFHGDTIFRALNLKSD